MSLKAQRNMYILSATIMEDTEASSIIELLSEISDTMQNIWWLVVLIFTVFLLIFSLFSIKRKANYLPYWKCVYLRGFCP